MRQCAVFLALLVTLTQGSENTTSSNHVAQSRNHNCFKICKNPEHITGKGTTIIYINQSKTIIGFYDSSTDYAFVFERKTKIFLIINVKTKASAIFSWSESNGYFLSKPVKVKGIYSGSSSIAEYFESLENCKSLKELYDKYKKYGKQFSLDKNGKVKGASEITKFFQGFFKVIFSESDNFHSVEGWESFTYAVYTFFTYTLPSPGLYEIQAHNNEVIEKILEFQAGSNSYLSFKQRLQLLLEVWRKLGESDEYFGDDVKKLLQGAHISQSPQLIGFLRFIQLLSSINLSAAYDALSKGSSDLGSFLLPNSRFDQSTFEAALASVSGLDRLIRVFIRASGGGNWISIFSSSEWNEILQSIPGLKQFSEFISKNPGYEGLVSLGEAFAKIITEWSHSISELANSGPFPNPFGPAVGAIAGGIGGIASQASEVFHLFGVLDGDHSKSSHESGEGDSKQSSESNESRRKH